jgi:hypothetical protein
MDATDAVRDALRTIRHWLEQAEQAALRDSPSARHYLLIRPVSLTSPPPPEAMAEITAAITALAGHGLIITADDD